MIPGGAIPFIFASLSSGNPTEMTIDSIPYTLSPTTPIALQAPSTYTQDGNRTGNYYQLTFNSTGYIKIKMWGAGGAGDNFSSVRGGAGGYTEAEVYVQASETYLLLVGQPGWTGTASGLSGSGGFGGGGTTHTDDTALFGPISTPYGTAGASVSHSRNAIGGGGGGASALFLNSVAIGNELIVAPGGGGAGYNGADGGAGGGLTGDDSSANGGKGGTQSAGGASGTGLVDGAGAAGRGGAGQGRGGGGGAGYFGGGGGADLSSAGGGGGSGYVNPSLTQSTLLAGGTGVTPGNSTDPDRNGAAEGGAASSDTYGGPGRVVIYRVV